MNGGEATAVEFLRVLGIVVFVGWVGIAVAMFGVCLFLAEHPFRVWNEWRRDESPFGLAFWRFWK